jgi:cystathionine beta-lyase
VSRFDHPPPRRHTRSIKWDARPPRTPEDLIPLWVADMDFTAPDAVIEALKARAEHGIFGYTCRDEEVDAAAVDWLWDRFGWKVEPAWLMVLPGIVNALYMVVTALTEPGEGVIVMPPVYHPFYEAIEKNGRRVVKNPLLQRDGAYTIDWVGLEGILERGESSLLIFCSPHNPVGRVWRRDELSRLAGIMDRHPELRVLSDEIHSDLILPGFEHTPQALMLDEAAQQRLITARSVSKTFNLAGLHTAYLIVRDEEVRQKIDHQLYLTGAGMPNPFGLCAMVAACRHGRPWLQELIAYLDGNNRFLNAFLASRLPGWRAVPLEGTYLAWIRITDLDEPVADLVERLREEAGVWLEAGTTYGSEGEGYVRLNLGTSRALLGEALERIARFEGIRKP